MVISRYLSQQWDTNPRPDDYEVFLEKWLPKTRRLFVDEFHLADGWGNHVVLGYCFYEFTDLLNRRRSYILNTKSPLTDTRQEVKSIPSKGALCFTEIKYACVPKTHCNRVKTTEFVKMVDG
jgi:hypothetical protein